MLIGQIVLFIIGAGGDYMQLRIKDMREDSDKTQKVIADYLKCDQSLYSKYERGERDVPLEIVVKLAIYYETSVDYLVGLTKEREPYPRTK
jgi:transcriptional regulator with XRE-family HTH domain